MLNSAYLLGYIKNVEELKKLPENFVTEKILCFKIETEDTLKLMVGEKGVIDINCVATSSNATQIKKLTEFEEFSGRVLLQGHLGSISQLDDGVHFIVDRFSAV